MATTKKWSAKVKTDSTKPGPGLFKKSAEEIAKGMESKKVSPKGPGQAMQMLNFYENRAGKNLPAERKAALKKAKELVHEKVEEAKAPAKKAVAKKAVKKTAKKTVAKKKASK
jgi:hypothetical protein